MLPHPTMSEEKTEISALRSADSSTGTGNLLCDLNSLGTMVHVGPGILLYKEGSLATEVSVLYDGLVKLSSPSSDGLCGMLRIGDSGQVLGLTAAITTGKYESSAETLTECLLRTISLEELLAFLRSSPGSALTLARYLSEQQTIVFAEARRLVAAPSASSKLAALLLTFGRFYASTDQTALCFPLPLTHEDLGHLSGLSRETITRTISAFKRNKLIHMEGSLCTILNKEALARLAI